MKNIKLAYIRSTWELSDGSYWKAQDIRGDLLTDLNLSFALIDSQGRVYLDNKEYLKKQVTQLHQLYPELRINLSIGGWGADGFSKAASTEKNRRIFADSTISLLKELNLDGADIDWEFPVGPDWGQKIKSSPADRENYILLLSDLRKTFDQETSLSGKYYTVTTAIPSVRWFAQKNDLKAVSQVCDYVNLMCYDYYGDWSETTGFNASLYANPKDPVGWSTDTCLKLYAQQGMLTEKIVLGFPTYGLAWKGVPENSTNGLFQKPKAFIGSFTYSQLEKKYSQGFEEHFDKDARQSYRYNPQSQVFVTYPSQEFFNDLTAYAKEHNLAGLMYWEYAYDMDAKLLQMINQ